MEEVLSKINSWVWDSPLIVLLVGRCLYFTIRLEFSQAINYEYIIYIVSDEVSLRRRGITGIGDPLDIGNVWRFAAISADTVSEYISIIRYGKNLKTNENLHSQILVRFLTKNRPEHSSVNLYKTYDGYVRAIPISASIEAFTLFCGASFKWVQLGGVYLELIKSVFGKVDRKGKVTSLTSQVIFENINVQKECAKRWNI